MCVWILFLKIQKAATRKRTKDTQKTFDGITLLIGGGADGMWCPPPPAEPRRAPPGFPKRISLGGLTRQPTNSPRDWGRRNFKILRRASRSRPPAGRPAERLPVGTFNGRFWTYVVLPLRYTPPSPAKDRAGDARHDNQRFSTKPIKFVRTMRATSGPPRFQHPGVLKFAPPPTPDNPNNILCNIWLHRFPQY